MEPLPFNLQFNKMIKHLTNSAAPASFSLETHLYKKLFSFLLPVDSYYFIINHYTLKIEFVSDGVEHVLGFSADEFDIVEMNDRIHPEDRSWFLTIGQIVIDFFSQLPVDKLRKYKVRYDIRIQKKNGEYARVLYEGLLLEHDDRGKFLRTLNMHTDITYLKEDGVPVLSFIGLDGEPSYRNVMSRNTFTESREEFTRREKEVLALLIQGKLSKEISDILRITKQTVDTHRKNMLRKKNMGHTGELISRAIRNGWI